MSEFMKFRNPTSDTISLAPLGIAEPVKPGDEIDIPLTLCGPGRKDNGARKRSPIEQCAPQLEPADPDEAREWRKTPAPIKAKSRIATLAKRPSSAEPPGVVAARAAKEAAERSRADQPKPAEQPRKAR